MSEISENLETAIKERDKAVTEKEQIECTLTPLIIATVILKITISY